jgi:hypothetical protein
MAGRAGGGVRTVGGRRQTGLNGTTMTGMRR